MFYYREGSILSLSMALAWIHCRPVCRRLQAATEAAFTTELLIRGAEIRIPWIEMEFWHRNEPPIYRAPLFTMSSFEEDDCTITFQLTKDLQGGELTETWTAFCRIFREGEGGRDKNNSGRATLFLLEGLVDVDRLHELRLDHDRMAITVAWKLLISEWCSIYYDYVDEEGYNNGRNDPAIRKLLGLDV